MPQVAFRHMACVVSWSCVLGLVVCASAAQAQLNRPQGIAVDGEGNVYVADTDNHRIQKFAPGGQLLVVWGEEGTEPGQLNYPMGVTVDDAGNVYVVDRRNDRVQKFTSEGVFILAWGITGEEPGEFGLPNDVDIDASGDVYVVDNKPVNLSPIPEDHHPPSPHIQRFSSDGAFISSWSTRSVHRGIAVDHSGNMYAATENRIEKHVAGGGLIMEWGSEGTGPGQFNYPSGVAVDDVGNVYVADTENGRIQKFTPEGQFLSQWENLAAGNYVGPADVAVDRFGNVYVANSASNSLDQFLTEVHDPFDLDKDGAVGAVDVQLVINAVLGVDVLPFNADVNYDDVTGATDVQLVINAALGM